MDSPTTKRCPSHDISTFIRNRHQRDARSASSLPEAQKSQGEVVRALEEMSKERQVKQIMQAAMQGRRPAGGPQTRWRDVLRRDLKETGLSLEEAAVEALDCDRWRRIVLASCDYNATEN